MRSFCLCLRRPVPLGSLLCVMAGLPLPGQAQTLQYSSASQFLLEQKPPLARPPVAHWLVAAQRRPQTALKTGGLTSLAADYAPDWLHWWQQLPVTGRTYLATSNPLALSIDVRNDPLLEEGQTLQTYADLKKVAVVLPQGGICLVNWQDGWHAGDYVRACAPEPAASHVGLVQPDMALHWVGIQPYSAQQQTQPQAGAWLLLPPSAPAWGQSDVRAMAEWLTTLPPAEVLLQQYAAPGAIQAVTDNGMPTAPPQDLAISASDWGEIGLLQTPSARMAAAGSARFTVSHTWPYTRGTVMLQPFDWLEAGFRYTDVANRLYGPESLSGSQSYKDKSIDFKFRLWPEQGPWQPQLALGMRDVGGTGLFSSEYVVANKRWGPWDASLGMAWGNLGSRGHLTNPLSVLLGKDWRTRPVQAGGDLGGEVATKAFLKGPAALFAGVQYQVTPQWLLKAEWDGNDYRHEPLGNVLPASSALNLGAVWRYNPWVDVSFGVERGERLGLALTLHTGPTPLGQMHAAKTLDVPLPDLRASVTEKMPDSSVLAKQVEAVSAWQLQGLAIEANQAELVIETDAATYTQERIDRLMSVLHHQLPITVQRVQLLLQERGLNLLQVDIDRTEWLRQHAYATAPETRLLAQRLHPVTKGVVTSASAEAFWQPYYSQILGGPDGFLLFQAGLRGYAEYPLNPQTWLTGQLNWRLLDNFDGFKYTGPSNLPRVRTLMREYVTTSHVTMPLAQLTTVQDVGDGHYVSAYVGALESMYSGVGSEWFYRPWGASWAVGVDANRVWQRAFEQDFRLRDYQVNTGHATLYWDSGWQGVHAKLSAGRYLAGDMGATLDLSRRFENGVSMGMWATKTNVSAAQFGEGSFDKGVYLNLPFDLMLPRSTPGSANMMWSPLTRDGGAKLNRRFALYDITKLRDPQTWHYRPALRFSPRSGEAPHTTGATDVIPWLDLRTSAQEVAHGWQQTPSNAWWEMGGLAVLSMAMNHPLDNWAKNHADGPWKSAANVTNSMPLLLGASNALLATGVAGAEASILAQRALHAGAYALAGSMTLKAVVQRERPNGESGAFSSNHMALVMAMAAPWAEYYQAPWLYGLAGSTALARVQRREHWASDTVIGGLLGYTVGQWLSPGANDTLLKKQAFITPKAAGVNWSF